MYTKIDRKCNDNCNRVPEDGEYGDIFGYNASIFYSTALFGAPGTLWSEGHISAGIVGAYGTHNVAQCADRKDIDIPRSINVEGHLLEAHQSVVGGSVSGNINQFKEGIQAMHMW